MSARGTAQEEKRQRILDAAVVVFARTGYHTSRVGDIAEEAGVAHGLLYHYFPSKEAVLQAIFQDNWAQLVGRFRAIAASDEAAADKLSGLAKIVLRTWRNDPALVTVMVREIARSPQLQARVSEITEGLEVIQAVISDGQATGEFRPDMDAKLAAWMFYGALEETLTGWVLGQLPDGEEEVARAERTVVDIICSGLVTGTGGR
jgi:TetR/AcrR family transcriptional regulator, fatty acid metabolism regulator protein